MFANCLAMQGWKGLKAKCHGDARPAGPRMSWLGWRQTDNSHPSTQAPGSTARVGEPAVGTMLVSELIPNIHQEGCVDLPVRGVPRLILSPRVLSTARIADSQMSQVSNFPSETSPLYHSYPTDNLRTKKHVPREHRWAVGRDEGHLSEQTPGLFHSLKQLSSEAGECELG